MTLDVSISGLFCSIASFQSLVQTLESQVKIKKHFSAVKYVYQLIERLIRGLGESKVSMIERNLGVARFKKGRHWRGG